MKSDHMPRLAFLSLAFTFGCGGAGHSETVSSDLICSSVERLATTPPSRGILWIDGSTAACIDRPLSFVAPSCTEGSLSSCTEHTFECRGPNLCFDRLHVYHFDEGQLVAQVRRSLSADGMDETLPDGAGRRTQACGFLDALLTRDNDAAYWELTELSGASTAQVSTGQVSFELVQRCDSARLLEALQSTDLFEPLVCRVQGAQATCIRQNAVEPSFFGSQGDSGWILDAFYQGPPHDESETFEQALRYARTHAPRCHGLSVQIGTSAGRVEQAVGPQGSPTALH